MESLSVSVCYALKYTRYIGLEVLSEDHTLAALFFSLCWMGMFLDCARSKIVAYQSPVLEIASAQVSRPQDLKAK